VLSILYLAVETRNNTNTIQSQTSQGLLELSNSYQLEVIGNPELADYFGEATKNLKVLLKLSDFDLSWRKEVNSIDRNKRLIAILTVHLQMKYGEVGTGLLIVTNLFVEKETYISGKVHRGAMAVHSQHMLTKLLKTSVDLRV